MALRWDAIKRHPDKKTKGKSCRRNVKIKQCTATAKGRPFYADRCGDAERSRFSAQDNGRIFNNRIRYVGSKGKGAEAEIERGGT